MTLKEALEFLIFYQLECPTILCDECPYNQEASEFCDCDTALEDAARIVRQWIESLPEGQLSNITLEDLL